MTSPSLAADQVQNSVADGHVGIGRKHVNRVDLDPHSFRRLEYRQTRSAGQQLDHRAFMGGIEMRDEDQSHAGLGRKSPKQVAESFEPTCGGSDGDNWK